MTARIALALTVLNLLLLVGFSARLWPAEAEGTPAMLRGSGLEIVDASGRVRASLGILPAADGGTETVLFRLIDANGQPSVKIATSETTAGLSFVGGDDLSYVIVQADGADATVKLVEGGERQVVVSP